MPPTVAEGATLEEVYAGEGLFEGPVWDPGTQALYFTACRAERILRLDASGETAVWMEGSGGVNGMVMGRDGRLLGAQVMAHRVASIGIGPDGPREVETLAEDQTWNQPNDVCETPSGHIYFTDPNFQDHSRSAVYHLAPSGEVTRVITEMAIPNGILCSLDGSELYVGDSHRAHWRAYPIRSDGSLGEGRLFFDPDTPDRSDPDGMAIDEHGNLYFSGRGGVWVVSPGGQALGLIPTPEFCANVGFGGPDGRTLFFTCRGKVYRLAMRVRGG